MASPSRISPDIDGKAEADRSDAHAGATPTPFAPPDASAPRPMFALPAGHAAGSPTRPFGLGWRRAGWLPGLGLRSLRGYDETTREARRSREALARSRDEAGAAWPYGVPAVAWAYEVYAGPPEGREAIEARLLAGESAE